MSWIPENACATLIATDFDGTLCGMADSPLKVRLSAQMLGALRRVADCPGLTLAVISGRSLRDLQERIPFPAILAGNHGLEISSPDFEFVHRDAERLRPELASACDTLGCITSRWRGAWVEDKGLSATLHFRDVDASHVQELNAAIMRSAGLISPWLALFGGKCSLDVRPAVFWDKGSALRLIQEKAGPFDWCICFGDDRTDEAMFQANAGRPSFRVGDEGKTAASHWLSAPHEVVQVLSDAVDCCRARLVARPQALRLRAGATGTG